MSNVETARSAYEAFGKGDLEALKDGFAENAVWITSEELPLGGRTEGRDQIMGNFAQIPTYWSEFSVEPDEFIDAGDTVIVRGTEHVGNDNGHIDSRFVHVIEYEDGKLVRSEFFSDSAKEVKLLSEAAAS